MTKQLVAVVLPCRPLSRGAAPSAPPSSPRHSVRRAPGSTPPSSRPGRARSSWFVATLLVLLGMGGAGPSPAVAQSAVWNQRPIDSGLPSPSPRFNHAMAYDSARGVTVLFGGLTTVGEPTVNGETWEWNGSAWAQRWVGGPSPRAYHAMAFDSARGVTVLFGGYDGSAYSGETWEWNGTTWSRRIASGPSPRFAHAMAFDSTRGVTVLFGGSIQAVPYASGETWEWNGVSWTQRSTAGLPAPSARTYHAMTYDDARAVTVLFGGYDGMAYGDDTWEWNGNTGRWTQRAFGGAAPSPRADHAMAYDTSRAVTVLFGGWTGADRDAETWEWDGSAGGGAGAWTQRVVGNYPAPSPRQDHAMAYDAARRVAVLFGGVIGSPALSDTDGQTWQFGCITLSTQPAAQTSCPAGLVSFAVAAAGQGPFTYQWQWRAKTNTLWVNVQEGQNVDPSGGPVRFVAHSTQTATLWLTSLGGAGTIGSQWDQRCIVTSPCGSVTSDAAGLSIFAACNPADVVSIGGVPAPGGLACPDGLLTGDDFNAFISAFAGSEPLADIVSIGGSPPRDGLVTGDDFIAFISAFASGCR